MAHANDRDQRHDGQPRPAPAAAAPAEPLAHQLLGLQRAAGNAAVSDLIQRSAGDQVRDVLRQPGQPLAESMRDEMEARIGVDLSDVRLHTGGAARAAAEAVDARAFTSRNHAAREGAVRAMTGPVPARPEIRGSGGAGASPAVPVVQRAPSGDEGKKKGKKKDKPLTAAEQLRKTYEARLGAGPLLNSTELAETKKTDGTAVAETGSYDDAVKYLDNGKYYDWLHLTPGRRALIATLAWERRDQPGIQDTPAYVLARGMVMHSTKPEDPLLGQLEAELNTQVHGIFAATLAAGDLQEDTEGLSADKIAEYNKKNEMANTLLRRLFVIIQQGLEVATAEGETSAERQWQQHLGVAARALAHGGRVNVRVELPALVKRGKLVKRNPEAIDRRSLPAWLEMKQLPKRSFSTHDITGRSEETLTEIGGKAATAGKLNRFSKRKRDERGADVAAGGMGTRDFNGDVIVPNGQHGHILLIYRAPTEKSIGFLQIGMETTAPESLLHTIMDVLAAKTGIKALKPKPDPEAPKNPVGYRHTIDSTEKTANPGSSFRGLKPDKIGTGELDTMRVRLSGDWLAKLKADDAKLTERIANARNDERRLREIFAALVGTKQDYERLLEGGEAPALTAPPQIEEDDLAITPAPRT
ncbi:DUF4157 domain-containing protein [Actinomycetes bacterium KLBMP 9797]